MIDKMQLMQSQQFHELLTEVQQLYDQHQPDLANQQVTLEAERDELHRQCQGWRSSLSNPELSPDVRRMLEADLSNAIDRIKDIDGKLQEVSSAANRRREAIDAEAVADQLIALEELMGGDNASAANVMLAQHIAEIRCDPQGKVVIRTCRLGALANPQQIALSELQSNSSGSDEQSRSRRRTRRDVGAAFEDDDYGRAANDFAVDPRRYSGLAPEWFTEDTFDVPPKMSWSEEHARQVAEFRLENQASMLATAEAFQKNDPHYSRCVASCQAEFHGLDAMGEIPRARKRPNWSRENADQVAEFFRQPGASMDAAVEHFGKSQPTISKARKFAAEGESQRTDSKQDTSAKP